MKRRRDAQSGFSMSTMKITGMTHLFEDKAKTESQQEDADGPMLHTTLTKRRRLNSEVPSSTIKSGDLFEKASQHMSKIVEQEERHKEEKQRLQQELQKYEKVHSVKESNGTGSGSRLKPGLISNNFVKTNLKRKKVQRKRVTRRKERFTNSESTEVKSDEEKEQEDDEKQISDANKLNTVTAAQMDDILESETKCDKVLTSLLQKHYGYKTFRPGQLEAIIRIIKGSSTLLIQPTGSGKSLCYQLPALVTLSEHYPVEDDTKNRITLVVSPLISLMRDQMQYLPESLPGACIFASQTRKERVEIFDNLKAGKIKILFISPERLCTDNFLKFIQTSNLEISFACVDEAHCVSQWSHNFRPSYLHIKSSLNRLGVNTILALTATATKATQTDICAKLFHMDGSNDDEFVIRGTVCRDNLFLSCSIARSIEDRFQEATKLLQSDKFKDLQSIIIYTLSRNDADSLANHLRLHMNDTKESIKSYHANLSPSERKSVEKQFMSGKIRIIVSTVAFGMGINCSAVRSVIHFYLPRSVENYVQEIGRAGRDGKPSFCHLLFSGEDAVRLRSLAFGERINEIDVKRCLQMIFNNGVGEFVSSVQKLEEQLDMPAMVAGTLLTHLELNPDIEPLIRCNARVKNRYSVSFLSTHPAVLAKSNKLIQAILDKKQKTTKNGINIFEIADVCSSAKKSAAQVEKEIEALKDNGEIKFDASGEAYSINILRVPSSDEIGTLSKWLIAKVRLLEESSLCKVDDMYKLALASSPPTFDQYLQMNDHQRDTQQRKLQAEIENYFTMNPGDSTYDLNKSVLVESGLVKNKNTLTDRERVQVLQDISVLLRKHDTDVLKTGKIIARILHGLGSPCFSPEQWVQGNFWGRYRQVDFPTLESLATDAILALKRRQ